MPRGGARLVSGFWGGGAEEDGEAFDTFFFFQRSYLFI